MPPGARSMLVSELETLCRDADIVPGQEPLDSLVDAAFDAHIPPGLVEDFDVLSEHHDSKEPLDDRAIRDAFLRFFCTVLRGYERFLVVPDADFLISGNEWFDNQAFLSSAPKENIAYLNSLSGTQLFQSFIQRRTEDSDVHCLMFDECLEYHSSPVPYGRLGGDVEAIATSNHSQPQMLYSLLVDQSAAPPYNGVRSGKATNSNFHDQSILSSERSVVDDTSRFDADSDVDSGSYPFAKPSLSTATDLSDSRIGQKATTDASDSASLKNSESVITVTGDIITAPPKTGLPIGVQFIYCVDGNPCFPHRLNKGLFLPREPESWLVEMSKTAPNPSLARSEREIEDANRRKKSATSFRGFHTQKRCLWQLPKLMVRWLNRLVLICRLPLPHCRASLRSYKRVLIFWERGFCAYLPRCQRQNFHLTSNQDIY
jgi:dDENN domain